MSTDRKQSDSKGEKNQKDEKKPSKKQQVPSISEVIAQLQTFADNEITQHSTNIIIENLKRFKQLSLLLPLLDTLPQGEVKDIHDEIEKIANFLTKKLMITLSDPKQSSVQVSDKLFSDVLYNASLAIAKILPRNKIDFITQIEIENIPEKDSVYTSDRFKFDLKALVLFINSVHDFRHPQHRTRFNLRDIRTIQRAAREHDPELTLEVFAEEKRRPANLTPLDHDAIAIIREQDASDQVDVQNNDYPFYPGNLDSPIQVQGNDNSPYVGNLDSPSISPEHAQRFFACVDRAIQRIREAKERKLEEKPEFNNQREHRSKSK